MAGDARPLWRLVQARPVTVHTSQFPTLLSMPVRRFAPHLAPSRCSLLVGRSESEFRVIYVLIAFTLIITGGTIGYVVIEKWSWLDSFYMAIITVTTVGFAEVRPLTSQGRGFTIALLVLGVGSIFYAFGVVGEFLLSGHLGGLLWRRRMDNEINQIRNQVIVCGYGRTGFHVANELMREGRPTVVIDSSEDAVDAAIKDGHLAIRGDAGDDELLRMAGIERASGLVAAVAPDPDCLMVVLTARSLAPDLPIVARAEQEVSEPKLRKTRRQDPRKSVTYVSGLTVTHVPGRSNHGVEIRLDEIRLPIPTALEGMRLRESNLLTGSDANIVGIRKGGGTSIAIATSDTILNANDVILAIGSGEQLTSLRGRCQ